MAAPLDSLVDAVATLVDAFERTGIDYALSGAIAYSAWAEPRATRDVDLNVWLPPERLDECFTVLEGAGVSLDRHASRAKTLFYRPKDLADVGRLLHIQRGRLDVAFVRSSLVGMLGATDERIATWDRLVSDHEP